MRLKDLDDQEAWQEFYLIYWNMIINWARANGCSDILAEDIFQESVISIIKNLSHFKYDSAKGSFRGYLKRIVTCRVKDHFRSAKNHTPMNEEGGTAGPDNLLNDRAADIESSYDLVWLENLLRQSLEKTKLKVDRVTFKSFTMYVIEGRSPDYIIEKLPEITNANTIYQHKARLLKILNQEFIAQVKEYEEFNPNYASVNTLFEQALKSLKINSDSSEKTYFSEPLPSKVIRRVEFTRKKLEQAPPLIEEGKYILLIEDGGEGKWFNLKKSISIGRDETNTISFNTPQISASHALVKVEEDKVFIYDLQSTNGTFLNSRKIQTARLKNGDIVQIHRHYLIYCEQ